MASFNGTTGVDTFVGPNQDNTFTFEFGELQNADTVHGGNQFDELSLFDQGPFVLDASNLVNVRGIEYINFRYANAFNISLTLTNALVASSDYAGVAGEYTVKVTAGQGDDTFDLSAVRAKYSIYVGGDAGDDLIIGGKADGTFVGDHGDDHLVAGRGIELFDGNGHFGSSPDPYTDVDSVEGTASNIDGDTYDSGDGSSGGTAGETIDVTTAGTFAFTMGGFDIVNLANGANNATIDLSFFYRNFTINGGTGVDTVTVNDPAAADIGGGNFGVRMYGGDGDDNLTSGSKNDTLDGGIGDDELSAGDGNDKIYGGADADILTGSGGNDSLYGGAVADILFGGDGNDKFYGGADGDLMSGGDNDDHYFDVAAGDLISEGADQGYDTMESALTSLHMPINVEELDYTGKRKTDITGNGSANTIFAGDKNDTVHAGDGDDTVHAHNGNDTVFGEANDDTLFGEQGDDVLDGGAGDDVLFGGGGSDTLTGGGGFDTADFSEAVGALNIVMTGDLGTVTGPSDTETLSGIEYVIGGDFDDVFTNNLATVEFNGGGGFDTIDLSAATENLTIQGAEHIIGGSGNDFLHGIWLEGRDGNDNFYGSTGGDAQTFDGGDGVDAVTYSVSQVGDETRVDLSDNSNNQGAALNDILTGIENLNGSDAADDYFIGDGEDNFFSGHNGHNALAGIGGNDTLVGGSDFDELAGGEGDDYLIGGAFGDLLYGDEGIDTADYGSSGSITIVLIDSFGTIVADAHGGDAEGDYLENIENLKGGGFDDVLTGEDGNNELYGGGGNDTLTGGRGQDLIQGGTGDDTFIWLSTKDSKTGNKHDSVVGFNDGDKIDLSAIDAIGKHHDDAFHLTGNGGADAFTHAAGELRIFESNGLTLIQGDVDGNGGADFEIAVTTNVPITEADIIL